MNNNNNYESLDCSISHLLCDKSKKWNIYKKLLTKKKEKKKESTHKLIEHFHFSFVLFHFYVLRFTTILK
jgi:hypothetical protein